jgi:single-stranded-DNA-specific exonuclease
VIAARRIVRREPMTSGPLPAELHPVLARIYRARHVADGAELDRSLERLLPPTLLRGMDEAVALLEQALRASHRVLIVADYDADGATSCALLVRALSAMGASDVRYLVPNRFEYGYGLTPEIVALAAASQPALLVTVDNGISSLAGVCAARERGMKVLITDHHLPGKELPAANAIVNPNQPGDTFPSKYLAGVGVAFYLMLGLRARLRASGWFAERGVAEPNLARLLDLVALGTVADVVPLDHNNRILVAQGIARINGGQAIEGIRALARVGGRHEGRISAADLGYVIAPRLNAAGRLDDMSLGIECLLTDDPRQARKFAEELDRLNRERRGIERDMQQQAIRVVEALHLEGEGLPRGLCLFDESWHQGVIGLVAARIKERWHRPVIAFAPGTGTEIKGSARSIPGLHIRDTLDTVAARHPGLVTKFGGHAMAAGITLERGNFDAFNAAFVEEVARQLTEDDLRGIVLSDGELGEGELTLELAELLRQGGPWGQGFPEPVFDGLFEVANRRVVGERHLKLSLRVGPRSRPIDAIAFGAAARGEPQFGPHVRAAFRLDVNEYLGNRSLQLVIEHLEPA